MALNNYNYSEKLILAAYSNHINLYMNDESDDKKLELLSELCMDGMADPVRETLFVLDYLDRNYDSFLKDVEITYD